MERTHSVVECDFESPPQLPPWPVLSSTLDPDVTSHIIGFLNDESLRSASTVCWSFYHALVPCLRRVNLSGCQSFAEIGLWNYTGMEYFSGRINGHLVTNQFLAFLRYEHPRLTHVDFTGCSLSAEGLTKFADMMGPRLKTLVMQFPGETDHLRVGVRCKELSKTLSRSCSSLESLSLTCNVAARKGFDFSYFNESKTLRELAVTLDGAIKLPPGFTMS